jgi:predicted Zn-dependent protease
LGQCARNPVTGKRDLALISEGQEIAIGQEAHPEILAQFGSVEDEALQNYFNRLGQEMAAVSHRPNLPWHFTVVDDPLVNAFAVPGGYIYFTRGILSYMNNEAELAGVLGHEIGHVTARHSVSQISKAQLASLGLGVGAIFSPTFGRLSDLAQMGVGVLFLKFGRDDERESDMLGVQYMYEMGYDPHRLSEFFEVFEQMREESGGAVPSWLSSHPAPPERIANTRKWASEVIAEKGSKEFRTNAEVFLRQIEGIVHGDNPREGFTEEGVFYHPELRFRFDYPTEWKVLNSRSAVVILEPSQAAGIKLTLAPPESGSPQNRAEELAREPGVELLRGGSDRINGNPAYLAIYEVSDRSGNFVRALAAFINHRNHLYELMGLAPRNKFDGFRQAMEKSITSFRTLQDARILASQPDRIRLYQIKRGGTLRDVAKQYPNPRVDAEELALLNRIPVDQRLEAGRVVKVVEAGR